MTYPGPLLFPAPGIYPVGEDTIATPGSTRPQLVAYTDWRPLPRVAVTFAALADGTATINVYRQASGRQMPIRGAIGMPVAGGAKVIDLEVPFGIPVLYLAQQFDADGVFIGNTTTGQITVHWDGPGVILHNPFAPSGYVVAGIGTDTGREVAGQVDLSVFWPSGRAAGVGIAGQRRGIQNAPVFVYGRTLAESDRIDAMFGSINGDLGLPPFLCVRFNARAQAKIRLPQPLFLGVAAPKQRPVNLIGGGTRIGWDLSGPELDPPAVSLVEASYTRDDMDAAFDSRDARDAAYTRRIDMDTDFNHAGAAGADVDTSGGTGGGSNSGGGTSGGGSVVDNGDGGGSITGISITDGGDGGGTVGGDGGTANAPTADFTATTANLVASFTSTATPGATLITSTVWSFGDGSSGTGTTVSHAYAAAGTYTVVQQVTAADGSIATKSRTVSVVAAAGNKPPTAAFTATVVNLEVTVNGSGSTDSDGSVKAWTWNYGDGATATGVTPPAHTYPAAGNYTITLTVTDDKGAVGSGSRDVNATAPAGGTEPTGANLTSITALPGSRLSDRINSVSTSGVSFPPGTFTWSDFQFPVTDVVNATTSGGGMRITKPTTMIGSGIDSTILKMVPGSTSKHTDMTQSTGDLHYIGLFQQFRLLQDLTIQGVPIGDLSKLLNGSPSSNGNGIPSQDSPFIYSGVYLYHLTGALTFRRVKIADIPGSDHVNPGETGMVNWGGGTDALFDQVELDGGGVGATGFLVNNLNSGSLKWTSCYVHDLPYSAAISFYKAPGSHVVTNMRVDNVRTAYNHESNGSDTTVTYNNPRFGTVVKSHFAFGSNNGSVKAVINDPTDLAGNPLTTVKATILAGYSNQQQSKADVKVYRGGVDVTASVLKWS